MTHIRIAERAFRTAFDVSSKQYVCRSCLAQAARQLHTTTPRGAEPYFKKITNLLFGDKKAEEKKQRLKSNAATQTQSAVVNNGTRRNRPVKVKINGVKYGRARKYDPATDKFYIPSTSWDGLERVGGEQWTKKRLDMGEQYAGFLPQKRVELTNRQWQRLLHNVAIEVATLQQAGRSISEVCNAHPVGSSIERTLSARLSQESDGTIRVHFSSPEDEEAVLASIAPDSTETKVEDLATHLTQITRSETNVDWVDIKLQDPQIKLAVLKRAMQLSGKRIPDIQMNNATTLGALYEAFKVKEKSKKLFQASQVTELAQTMPNVTVYNTRRTPVHKEKAVGRWKIIEEELARRDLPIFGSRWVNGKEGIHLHEK